MSYGKIYETTWWGRGALDNTKGWGIVYADLVSDVPSLLSSLQARATYYENESGTKPILESLENC
jgi:hypothetical protein